MQNIPWKTVKIIVSVIAMIGMVIWAMNMTQSTTYEMANLTFPVSGGPVTITNPSDSAVAVQLVGPTSRAFSISSPDDALKGTAVRQGTGSASTYLYDMSLPAGVSEFVITRGSNINFVAVTDVVLQATVKSLTDDLARTIYLFTLAVIAGLVFYVSRVLDHSWLKMIMPAKEVATTVAEPVVFGQGEAARSYGDNRTK